MVRVLIILRHPILSMRKYPLPFLVPVILSVHIPLGACSKPVSLDAPVTHHGVSYERFLLHHTNCDSNTSMHFCMLLDIDPYIRKFVSTFVHSHLEHFIDPRHIGNTIHLWTAFHSLTCLDYSLPTSPSFWPISFRLHTPVGVSGKAFRDVTPSFHLLDYQFS